MKIKRIKVQKNFSSTATEKKLLAYCKKKEIHKGWGFITKSGKLKDRSNIWREMKRLKEKAGVQASKIFLHNLRHFFAREYYDFTKDIAGLADLLGHTNAGICTEYGEHSDKGVC